MNDTSFWTFALERQTIWHRRFVLGLPQPWTFDSILQKYKFTNCQRILDRGTQVLVQKLNDHLNCDPGQAVLNIMLHRAYNVEDVPWVNNLDELHSVVWDRNVRWEAGEPMFTNAWMITGGNNSPAERLEKAVRLWNPEQLSQDCKDADSLKDVYSSVKKQAFFGGATVSWQVTLDLTYRFDHLNDDEWIPEPNVLLPSKKDLGQKEHGPRAAAKMIAPEMDPLQLIYYLRNNQPKEWKEVEFSGKPRLSLADIEHTLCEFCKYQGIKEGRRTGRKFSPRIQS